MATLLLKERDHRVLELLRERRRSERGQRHKVQAVHDRPAKARGLGILIIIVQRMCVARECGK